MTYTVNEATPVKKLQKKSPSNTKQSPSGLRIIIVCLVGIIVSASLLILWMTVSLYYHATWLPVGISVIIATTIKIAGKSDNPLTGVFSAFCSLSVALAGNVLLAISSISHHGNSTVNNLISQLDISFILTLIKVYTRPIDILMYAGTIYGGYWFSLMHHAVRGKK